MVTLKNQHSHTSKGFTLLELLVALAVFAVLAVTSYGSLNAVLETQNHTSQAAKSLQRLQMSLTLLQRDIMQLSDTTIQDEYGDVLPAIYTPMDGSRLIEFTRSGWNNPAQQARSHLQRVAYRLEDNTLYREYWPRLHRATQQLPLQAVMLENIEEFEFEFLAELEGNWYSQWPPPNLTQTSGIPLAIRFKIVFQDETEITRLFGINQ